MDLQTLALIVVGAVGAGAVGAGLGVRVLSPKAATRLTLTGVGIAFLASVVLAVGYAQNPEPHAFTLYRWGPGDFGMKIGFLIDSLSVVMMIVVTLISLLVHVYSIGYMRGDPGYVRFFAYLSLFTLAMLLLVMADNFLLLFIGWEGVGLVSYLLIGFWYTRERAPSAGLKAFLVNRLGDFGFLLGMGALLAVAGSLDYSTVFAQSEALAQQPSPFPGLSALSLICLLLFVGAMGKSAQVPLHVWLPDSMEGPTPISAMIHAATMVTAGIFMVARLSPLFEGSEVALNLILLIGGVTALSMGLLGLVANDIKQVIAYSTLSQLGYMTLALGASAYAASIFHLFTHAFFKALLFLAAGSVILAMHHGQDIRHMGGLARRMPITATTFAIGSLALIGMPGFAGFFSKESIIEALAHSDLLLAKPAHFLALAGVAVTALYSLRLWWYVFQGAPRSTEAEQAQERDSTVVLPLVLLAMLTLVAGFGVEAFLYGGLLGDALVVHAAHDTLARMAENWNGLGGAILHGFATPAVWLLGLGLVGGYFLYAKGYADKLAPNVSRLRLILIQKYGFDVFYENWVVRAARGVADACARIGDQRTIDGLMVNGTARMARRAAATLRQVQSGVLGHYALAMLLGLIAALGYLFLRG